MYKRALHSFFLKVHPDFFALHKEAQTANEKSIAQLNELLGWAKEFKAGAVRPPPAMSLNFTFYSQNDDSTPSPTASSSSSSSATSDGALTPITSRFELPPSFTATDANRGVAERSVNKFLRDLLRRANCMDTAAEAQSVAEDAESERMEVKPLRRRVNDTQRAKLNSKKTKTLLDEATESMAERWTITESPTAEELMAADQILFSRTLSPLQSAAALQSLQVLLGDMQYHRWAAMPLIISDQYAIGEITGAISVSWDFTLDSFLTFLDKNSKQIAECEAAALGFAQTIESLITQVCKELDIDDILISCSHRDALPALQLLKAQAPVLRAANVSKVTLEIANKFGYRDNGVVIIDRMATPQTLREALARLAPRMGMQQQLYKASKMMLESTDWHLQQFRENAKPRGVDAFNNDYTYAERLQFAKELFSIAPTLAQWDWSEFIFTLGDLDIDWGRQMVVLPPNFDGQSFLRYVEEVHKAAKDMKMEQLTEDVLTDAKVEAATKKFNYSGDEGGGAEASDARRAMLESQREDSRRRASHGPVKSNVVEGSAEDSAIDRDALAAHQQQAASMSARDAQRSFDLMRDHRKWLQRNNPHLEEYLASSPDGTDQLSVERPLHHDMNFDADENSGAVADDNLRWEGFYDQPYAETTPARDFDDVAHAYLNTDRKYREEAVKRLVKEMQERMGSGKKGTRGEQYKMGDLMGLNNPKARPTGFPTVVKGTARGEGSSIRPF